MSDDGYATPDEAEAYARGYAKAHRNHEVADRIAAFGAIRRAAAYAKHADREGSYDTAADIRRAIRAAIGSAKT